MRVRLGGVALAALACALSPACVPVVTHSPWVEPGGSVGTVAALSTQPTLVREVTTGQGSVTEVLAPFGVFARYGWTPERGGTPLPVSAAVFVPIALPFSIAHPEADLYAQLTPAGQSTGAGAGVLVSTTYTTPYLQAGRRFSRRASVYTTQAVALFRGGERAPDATVWTPSLVLEAAAFHLFVQPGLGRERLDEGATRPVRFLMAGLVMVTR